MTVKFTVTGKPAPQGSKTRGANGGLFESSKAVRPWREAVRAEAQRAFVVPIADGVGVTLEFFFPRPKSHYRTGRNAHLLREAAPAHPTGKPDLDKLCRAVLDGLTEGGAWKDDAQVIVLVAVKFYGVQAGCNIEVTEMEKGTRM